MRTLNPGSSAAASIALMRRGVAGAAIVLALALGLAAPAWAADAPEGSTAAEEESHAARAERDYKHWKAENEVTNLASLQRGARNYMGYCASCHSLKYVRYSRMAEDLDIPLEQLEKYLLPPGSKPADYILTSMPTKDAESWFGKAPPDLSLIARSRGTDYLYQLWKTYYVDPSKPTGVNNLRLEGIAMPHVLSELEGVKRAVFKTVETKGEDGKPHTERVLDKFEIVVPGRLSADDYDTFVRDTVNFLDYAGEPTQVKRRSLGVWVVLFLIAFTWLTMLLKKEYWKDVH
jgi:ubiquinol-cytochrome c reductase cytochrome c1 subunit